MWSPRNGGCGGDRPPLLSLEVSMGFGIMDLVDPLGAVHQGGASNIIDDVSGATSAREANAANQQTAREQMAFQERMSSSAYQRATADMKAAGINPMLAAQNGGASSPGGARADVAPVPTKLQGVVSTAEKAASLTSTAGAVAQAMANVGEANSRAAMNYANRDNIIADTANKGPTGQKIAQETATSRAHEDQIRQQIKIGDPQAKMYESLSKIIDKFKPAIDGIVGPPGGQSSAKKVWDSWGSSPANSMKPAHPVPDSWFKRDAAGGRSRYSY